MSSIQDLFIFILLVVTMMNYINGKNRIEFCTNYVLFFPVAVLAEQFKNVLVAVADNSRHQLAPPVKKNIVFILVD